MEVFVAKGKEWLGHKEGTKLNLVDSYAKELMDRGVVERSKMLIRGAEHNKQVSSDMRK